MQRYILRRILLNLLVIGFVATIVFLLLRIDSDYVVDSRCLQEIGANPAASEDVCDLIRKELGLDGSLFTQYKAYVWDLAHFDLGESFQAKDDVTEEIGNRLGPSLELGLLQIIV